MFFSIKNRCSTRLNFHGHTEVQLTYLATSEELREDAALPTLNLLDSSAVATASLASVAIIGRSGQALSHIVDVLGYNIVAVVLTDTALSWRPGALCTEKAITEGQKQA